MVTMISGEKWQSDLMEKTNLGDQTIIELSHRKISLFVSVSQINYLPQPSASANN